MKESKKDRETAIARGLIFGRLGLIFILLLASWWWTTNYLELAASPFPNRLFLLFVLAVSLTSIYVLFLQFSRNFRFNFRLQFLIDIALVSWIVSTTGEYASPYVTLYLVLISVSGYFLDRKDTLVISVLCAAAYSSVSIYSEESIVYSFTGAVLPSRFVQTVAFNSVGILIVGLLAGHLSERRNVSQELIETVASFDDLSVLHERILQSIPSGLITTDLSGRIQTVNRSAEEISGLSEKKARGESVYRFFAENIRPAVDLCLFRAAEGMEFPAAHFESVITKSLAEFSPQSTVSCTVSPLIGKDSNINGLILSFQDISQIRAMEESLRQADRLAVIGRMAAGMAHEIRNPLGSMSSAMQFLEENVRPKTPEANLLEVVLKESERLNEIITNFMTYAQLSSGGLAKDKFEDTDIGAAIQDCLTLLKHSPEVNETYIFKTELPDHPVRIMANQAQVKQVLWNLLQNSIHAMPTGGTILIRLTDFPGKRINLLFEDDGFGISPEKMNHLYEPFVSGSNGAGLGLSIVHNIVLDHGGSIDVKSAQNEGTKVSVELPY